MNVRLAPIAGTILAVPWGTIELCSSAWVELIGATATKTGLTVECALDERTYEKGIRVSNAEMKRLDIHGDPFHPDWNYTIKPRHPNEP